jgi:mycothiol synthase
VYPVVTTDDQHGPLLLRAATFDDAQSLAELLDECTQQYLERASSLEDALSRLGMGDPALDSRIALDSNANARGFGHVWKASPDEARGFIRVRPSARGRGVGSTLLSWLEGRVGELARELDPGAELTLTSWAQDTQGPPLLERAGFAPVRHFLQMRVDLPRSSSPRVAWPDGVTVRALEPGKDDAALFAAFREAFTGHWGDIEVSEADWWHENRDAPNAGFDPSLWFVAVADGAIAGFSLCREQEVDGEATGWVSLLAVPPSWRGHGLGTALLLHSLDSFEARGYRRAALNVDVDNATGALRLYEKTGMSPIPAFTIWSKALAGDP